MNGRSPVTPAGDCGLSATNTSATNVTPCVARSRAVHMARTFSRTDRASDDKLHFTTLDGSKSWRAMVGYKSIKARGGDVRIRNWHFGVEGVPQIGLESYIGLLPHVAFSEDGEIYASTKKQHACRRSQCKNWYNDDWRDRLVATLQFLAGNSPKLQIALGSEAFADVDAR
jgi:hypothetical protein